MQGKKKGNCAEELIQSYINLSENSIYTYLNSFRVLIFQDKRCKLWTLLIALLPLMFVFFMIFSFLFLHASQSPFSFAASPFLF